MLSQVIVSKTRFVSRQKVSVEICTVIADIELAKITVALNWLTGGMESKKAAALARSNRVSASLANNVDHELDNEDSREVNNTENMKQQAHHFGQDEATQTNH